MFTSDDKSALDRLAGALLILREENPGIPSVDISLLLEVARRPGLGSSEYARGLGMSQAIVSRILQQLGGKHRAQTLEPLRLVDTVRDAHDLRLWHHYLTPKGEALIERVLHVLNQGKSHAQAIDHHSHSNADHQRRSC